MFQSYSVCTHRIRVKHDFNVTTARLENDYCMTLTCVCACAHRIQLKHDFSAIAAQLENDYSTILTWLHEKKIWISTTHIRLWEVWLLHWERRTKERLMQYYGSIRNNWLSELATSIQLRLQYVQFVSENGMPIYWNYELWNLQATHQRQTSTSSRSGPHHSRTLHPLPVVDSPR
jgi:hypothetical protein